MLGAGSGLAVGLVVTYVAKLIQRLKWKNRRAFGPSLDLLALESLSNMDERISPSSKETQRPDEGIIPAP
jgi:hypothetical protein